MNAIEIDQDLIRLCNCCDSGGESEYKPKSDVKEWIEWKLTDESWEKWRLENPELAKSMQEKLKVNNGVLDS